MGKVGERKTNKETLYSDIIKIGIEVEMGGAEQDAKTIQF